MIMMYSFGRMYNRLAAPDFDVRGYEANHGAAATGPLMKHAVWILRIIQMLPDVLLKRLDLAFESFVELNNVGSAHPACPHPNPRSVDVD